MLTVSDLAKQLNVSVQSVYKKINKSLHDKLKNHIETINGQKLIDEHGAELIRNSFKPVLNSLEHDLIVKENEDLKKQIESLIISKNADIEQGLNDFKQVQSQLSQSQKDLNQEKDNNIKLLQEIDQIKQSENDEIIYLREQNKQYFETVNQQSNKILELADKLTELTRNSQILLKQEQDKNNIHLLPDEQSINEPKKNWLQKIFSRKK
jgi:CTP-dependent riboflavin kinase